MEAPTGSWFSCNELPQNECNVLDEPTDHLWGLNLKTKRQTAEEYFVVSAGSAGVTGLRWICEKYFCGLADVLHDITI